MQPNVYLNFEACDAPPPRYRQPKGFFIEQTFGAQKFAMLMDRFGISWMMNCEATQ